MNDRAPSEVRWFRFLIDVPTGILINIQSLDITPHHWVSFLPNLHWSFTLSTHHPMASLSSSTLDRVGLLARAQCQQLASHIHPVHGTGCGQLFWHVLSQTAHCTLQPQEATPFSFNLGDHQVHWWCVSCLCIADVHLVG